MIKFLFYDTWFFFTVLWVRGARHKLFLLIKEKLASRIAATFKF